MGNRITDFIGRRWSQLVRFAATLVGVFAVYTVLRLDYSKWLKKKNKDEESAIENVRFTSDAATQTIAEDQMTSVRGLQNLGNTCYFNSTMQALAHTNLVFRDELNNLHKKGEFIPKVLKLYSTMQAENSGTYSPNDLHRTFGKKSPKFADYRQHDSHECLRNFLDNIRNEERDNSGAADKRKVLTVVDSVFGGHFITVYICEKCEAPYHVCEALLDISLPIMIDEEDLAAMNSAHDSKPKRSRTVKLQTPKIQINHLASQTDDTNERKLAKSPIDVLKQSQSAESDYKSTAVENEIELKPNETEQASKLDATLQQNTSDQTFQLKSKTETCERHSSNVFAKPLASGYEFGVNFASTEPEVKSVLEKTLRILNNMVDVSPTNVELENTASGKTKETFKENSLAIQKMIDPGPEFGTFSLDDKEENVEESKTTFGTETNMGKVFVAKELETPDEDNKEAKIPDEDKKSRDVSDSETLDENVEYRCSSTKAENNLAEKNDTANIPSIRTGTEDNKESEDHEWEKSDACDNLLEIQEYKEEQKQSSEERQREATHHDRPHSHHTELAQEQRNAEDKIGGKQFYNADPHPEIYNIQEIEDGQHFQNSEKDQKLHGIQEKRGEHIQNSELDEEHQFAQQQHERKPALNDHPEKQHKDADGHYGRNTEPKEVEEENKDEQEEHEQRAKEQKLLKEREDKGGQEHEKVQDQKQKEQDVEQKQQNDKDENGEEEDEHEKKTDEEEDEEKDQNKEEEEVNDEQQNLKQDQDLKEKHTGKHILNVHPEKPNRDTEEQQDGQCIRNTETKEVKEENKEEKEDEKRYDGKEQVKVQAQKQNPQDIEQAQQKDDDESDDKEDGDEREEDKEKGDEEENDEQHYLKKDQEFEEQRDGKHPLNVEPEEQHKDAEEKQAGLCVRDTETKELGVGMKDEKEERDQEVKEQKQKTELESEEGKEQVQRQNQNEQGQYDNENDDKGDEDEKEADEEEEAEEAAPEEEEEDEDDEDEEEEEEANDEQQNLIQDQEQEEPHVGKHLLSVEAEKQQKAAEMQQDVQRIRNTELKGKGKENEKRKQVVEEQKQQNEHEDEEELEGREFEVEEYASETNDRYRRAIDELMTPLSSHSPCLPNSETASKKHVTVDDCLMYFTRKEHIKNEYLCNDCYSKHLERGGTDVLLTSATKQTMIFNPPAILTLHLKRFELKVGGSVKRTDMITYGEFLDIAPYCSSMCLRNDPPCRNIWYSLYGVVVHHGSTLKSGHYIAYVKIKGFDTGFKKLLQKKFFDRDLTKEQLIEMMQKRQSGETNTQSGGTWYCMNDSWFGEVSVKEVLNQEAYLLFYERMH